MARRTGTKPSLKSSRFLGDPFYHEAEPSPHLNSPPVAPADKYSNIISHLPSPKKKVVTELQFVYFSQQEW